jgi:carbon-monoxide dehydrogenase medium subunit
LAALTDAAALFGGRQIRNVATVGGNLCSASPAAELATPLLVLDATAEVVGPGGARDVALADLWAGPRRTVLAPGEVLRAARLPAGVAGSASAYQRLELRRSVDIALVSVSARLDVADGEVVGARLAVGAAAPTPFRAEEAEALLVGLPVAAGAGDPRVAAAAAAVAGAARPIDDVRASAAYRRAMLEVVAVRAVAAALARVAPAGGSRP